jgi:hypothetical protein
MRIAIITVNLGKVGEPMIVDPVSEDEVFERLRTRLASRDLALHRGSLDGMKHDELGRFYTTRADSESIVDRHVDIERWARQEGALKPNEALVPSKGSVS